jgi:hypothetical protein
MSKELFKALSKFQGECPTIDKSKKGAWGMYADLSEIIETIRPIMSKNGLAITQMLHSDETGTYLETMLCHESGGFLASKVKEDYSSENIQKFGSSITYLRRYALSSILGIVSDVDLKNDVDEISSDMKDKDHKFNKTKKVNPTKVVETPKHIPTLSKEQVNEIMQMLSEDDVEWFTETIKSKGYSSINDIESSKFSGVCSFVKDYKESKASKTT